MKLPKLPKTFIRGMWQQIFLAQNVSTARTKMNVKALRGFDISFYINLRFIPMAGDYFPHVMLPEKNEEVVFSNEFVNQREKYHSPEIETQRRRGDRDRRPSFRSRFGWRFSVEGRRWSSNYKVGENIRDFS